MIDYRLRIADAHAHLVEIEIATFAQPGETRFALPAWSPGSYLVRDYARNVRDFEAFADGDPHRTLRAHKADKQTWSVGSGEARRVTLRYRVYAHEMTVRTSHVDAEHAFLHGPSLFMYDVARPSEPVRLRVEVPDGWQWATALLREGDHFLADSYDQLVDSPIELARELLRIPFEVAGTPHEIAVCGRPETPIDPARLASDVARIVEQAATLFDGLPYSRYLFILHLSGGAGAGGLEHRDSSALLASPQAFRPHKKYEDLLELFSHEHFHVWNVKRIRPRALGPFDYTRENYTRSLWVMEGLTSYYDRHLLVRAKLLPAKRYLEKLGEELARLRSTPGRLAQSLEESSFDAWIKFYKPDEATPNSTISYYLKGSLVAVALDLELRRLGRSLDPVLRLLWQRFGRAPSGFDDDAVQSLFEEATGHALGPFFDRYVRGRGELDLERFLALAGLVVEEPKSDEPEGSWLGIQTREVAGRAQVSVVLAGGPGERAGLAPGDEIVALDGFRVDERGLRDRLGVRGPGETVRMQLFRREFLTEIPVVLGKRPPESYTIKPDPNASPEARALYQSWLGVNWEA